MTMIDWLQILIFILIMLLVTPLMGKYMALVLDKSSSISIPILSNIEHLCYRLCAIDPQVEMTWKIYLKNLLVFNFLGFLALFLIQIFQFYLPLNPQHFPGVSWDLAFNNAASFTTNTDWQAYNGEVTLSYFTQMMGLTTQNFLSAATGMSVLLAFIRGLIRKHSLTIGNFWTDLIRSIVYIFLPLSLILSLVLVHEGVIQSLSAYVEATTLENETQILPLGPVASQVAIKQLGTNGGGYFGVNSAHPFENPTPISNYMEHLAIILIPASLFFTYGYLINSLKQGAVLFYVMLFFWITAIVLSGYPSFQFNPALNLAMNMEGIETRFNIPNSFFWTMSTTDTSNGSINASITSLAPLTIGIALFNIMLGELIMGGVGVGLCTMLKFVLLTVFIAGLMVGRTPEYLGKKIEKTEILWVIVAILVPCGLILGGAAISFALPAGFSSVSQNGPHGYIEILYAFASASGNNGSALEGLNANTIYYNLVLGVVFILSRLAVIVPSLAIAGSLANKRYYPPSRGSLGTDSFIFGMLLSGVIFIIGALTFFPALILGPILEHLLMMKGVTF